MGCGASKTTAVGPPPKELVAPSTTVVSPINTSDNDVSIARAPQGLAFEVSLDDASEDGSSLIKKHPPKRFQRLEDQQVPALTHEALDEKQAEAEQRRLQLLNQRVQSAKARQKLKRTLTRNGDMNENGFMIESMNHEPSTIEI